MNNSPTQFGTCSLISTAILYDNVKFDHAGRAIIFDLPELENTVGNIYLQCGADRDSRNSREEYGSRFFPELLTERRQNIVIGGDWNSIILRSDCTRYPDQKMS